MAAVFPDAAACLENIPGDRADSGSSARHPDGSRLPRGGDGLRRPRRACSTRIHAASMRLRRARHAGAVAVRARDPQRAGRTRSWTMRRSRSGGRRRCRRGARASRRRPATSARSTPTPSTRVRDEARPDPRDADELHDALLTAGFLTTRRAAASAPPELDELRRARRARRARRSMRRSASGSPPSGCPSCCAVHPDAIARAGDRGAAVARRASWTRDDAIVELLRGRLAIVGPTTAAALGAIARHRRRRTPTRRCWRSKPKAWCCAGSFTPGSAIRPSCEWCDRALLARIHRYTLNRLRAEIEPVSPADFMRFLFAWQHVDAVEPADRPRRPARGRRAARRLRAAGAARGSARCCRRASIATTPSMLDMLCLTGEVGWARLSLRDADARSPPRLVPATPIALFLREHADAWQALRDARRAIRTAARSATSARAVLDAAARARRVVLQRSRAALRRSTTTQLRRAIGALVAAGLVASDGFAGLRALVAGASRRARRVRDRRDALRRAAGRAIAPAASRRDARGGASRRRRGRCSAATASCSAGC